ELRSTTEELEINKEELQSMNEELETANYELKHSIDELSRTHSDLLNFITSTEVGVIFLDRGLRIKRFTPRTVDLFHLIEGDIGRPLAHVTHRLRYTRLAEQAAHVLDQLEELELLVQSEDERWYIARLLPYRTIEDQIDGVVLTFIDVTDLKRAEYEVQQRIQQQTVAELGRLALAERSLGAILAAATARVAEVLEVDICQLLELQPDGESLLLTAGKGFRPGYVGQVHVPVSPRLQVGYTLQVGQPVVLQSVRQEVKFGLADHLVEHQIVSGVTVAISSGDRAFGVLGAYSVKERTYSQFDIDFLQSVANLLAAAMARRTAEAQIHFQARLLDAVEQAVIAVNREFKITYWNRFAEHLYGWSAQEVLGRALADIIIPPDQRTLAGGIRQQLRAGESWAGEFMMRRRNGAIFPAYVTDSPIFNGTGELVGTVGVSFDISDRKQVEKSLRESEQRFRTMADTAPVLIWTAGPDGLCDFFNQPWLTFTGRTMEASLGKGWSEDLHPEDYERCLSTYRAAFASRQPY
ncbi:MAG TPA: PAS domain S-box protein, partial [Caldilineaceae bacterium]|nr:PAS domain S-box protein [Caldilineaceae bacterium]